MRFGKIYAEQTDRINRSDAFWPVGNIDGSVQVIHENTDDLAKTERHNCQIVTAQFKRQWGTNLKKFSGIQLPGGVTLDGDKLYDEATAEIAQLEDELMRKSAPLDFFLG